MYRQLRVREPTVYNLDLLEKQQAGDVAITESGLRASARSSRTKVLNLHKDESESVDGDLSQAETSMATDGDVFQPGKQGAKEAQMQASESESDFVERRPTRTMAVPSRQQPRRGAAAICLKEDSGSFEDDEDEDDLPLERMCRSRGGGEVASAEGPPGRGAGRGLSGKRDSSELSSVAEGTPSMNRDSDGSSEAQSDIETSAKRRRTGKEPKEEPAKRPKERRSQVEKAKKRKLASKGGTGKMGRQDKLGKGTKKQKAKPAVQKAPAVKAEVVEKILDTRTTDGLEEVFVKYKGKSYRQAMWVPSKEVWADKGQLLRNFIYRRARGLEDDEYGELQNGIHPDWLLVERIIAQRGGPKAKEFLVKWCGLPYAETSWETEALLSNDQIHIKQFKAREQRKAGPSNCKPPKKGAIPVFQNGRKLRDYQVESLNWIMDNMRAERNCILGDEMGLGKTAQSIAVLEFQHQLLHKQGPFLVIAPLTTLGHWQREIQTWTDMYVVQYVGSAADREVIKQHELYHCDGTYKFHVLLSSYEMVLRDERVFSRIPFDTVIIDEAHRMKSTGSQQRGVIDRMMDAGHIKFLLLLTGTPVQNNLRELYGLMNLLDNTAYPDEAEFFAKFGGDNGPPTIDQIKALQEALRPILLRRMKEDVETLPEKEEVIVWVELTQEQRRYYKAIYSQQIGTLMAGASTKNMPNLRNLAMELRKVCCHPYLCNGLEDDIFSRQHARGDVSGELERMVGASGKMVLLGKLLPKLHAEGHKVLIFSQFKIMLDVIEDALRLMKYPLERIDGSVAQKDRQSAIDRFSKGEADSFIFLLSTRAGGQGITLTAADTVIIYDSDWNPQNDLQAMARCHRIGQSKEVTIYRLLSRDTYEAKVFEASTRKYGLDEALLGNMAETENPEEDNKRIADLLRHGAHGLVGHEEEKAREEEAFQAEGIDAILAGRTMKRSIGSRKGNTFSTASFTVEENAKGLDNLDDRAYWASLMPEALAAHNEQVAAAARPVELAKRERKVVNYNEKLRVAREASSEEDTGAKDEEDYVAKDEVEEQEVETPVQKKAVSKERVKEVKEARKKEKFWSKTEVRIIEDTLIQCGPIEDRDAQAAAWEKAGLRNRSVDEGVEVLGVLQKMIHTAGDLCDAIASHKQAYKEWEKEVQLAAYFGNAGKSPPEKPPEKDWDLEPLMAPSMAVPTLALRALTARDTQKRIRTNGRKYLHLLKAREEFKAAWEACTVKATTEIREQKLESMQRVVMPNHQSLPSWWEWSHDLDLLETMYMEGYDPRKSREFAEAFLTRPGSIYASLLPKGVEELGNAVTTADSNPAPQDPVLRSAIAGVVVRIKHLLLALMDPVASHRNRCLAKRKARMEAEAARAQEDRRLAEERMAKAEALGGSADMSDAISMDDSGRLGNGDGPVDLTHHKRPHAKTVSRSAHASMQPKAPRPVQYIDLDSNEDEDGGSDFVELPAPSSAKRKAPPAPEQAAKATRSSGMRSPSAASRGMSGATTVNDRPTSAKTRVTMGTTRPRSGSTADSSVPVSKVRDTIKSPLKSLDPNSFQPVKHGAAIKDEGMKVAKPHKPFGKGTHLRQSTLNFAKR